MLYRKEEHGYSGMKYASEFVQFSNLLSFYWQESAKNECKSTIVFRVVQSGGRHSFYKQGGEKRRYVEKLVQRLSKLKGFARFTSRENTEKGGTFIREHHSPGK